MKPSLARALVEQLRPLTPLHADELAVVAGGESASTSTSGTPDAGDDTIGDRINDGLKVYIDVVY